MDIQSAPVTVTKSPDGVVRIAVKGPVHINVQWLEGEFDRVIAARPKQVELDLADTDYISSLGIGLFVKLFRSLTTAGSTLRIIAIRKKVLSTFRFARLDTLFKIDPSAVIDEPR